MAKVHRVSSGLGEEGYGGGEWCPKTTPPTSWRKSPILFISEIQKETNRARQGETQKEKELRSESGRDRQTEPFPAPSPCLAPTSTHPTLLSRLGRSRFREVPHLPRGRPAVPAPQPVLPDLGVPSSPGSSHSSARVGHSWAWGPGAGSGPRP